MGELIMKIMDGCKVCAMGLGAAIGWFFGGFDTALRILIVLAVLDFVTGVISAWVNQELESGKAFRGAWKKVFMFVVIGVANMADLLLGQNDVVRMGAVVLYCWTEMVSLTENAGRMGVPLPDSLVKALKVIKGLGEKDTTIIGREKEGQ